MKVLRKWLADYIDIGEISDQTLSETLENLGHEVESMVDKSQMRSAVVGLVLDVKPHPNADRLRIAKVDTGDAERTIVCGAPNLEIGQKVPVALVGAKLPNGLVIALRSIRGIESDGMICAPDELGMNDDHTGILILPARRIVGEPFEVGDKETVFDLAVTANRGDVLSYQGVARELAAKHRLELKITSSAVTTDAALKVAVEVQDPIACPLYTVRLIQGIERRELPRWISDRLTAVGHSLYHPIVDITNYVMEELGVPLHAFDAQKIQGALVVRPAWTGETIRLLDGKLYQLETGMLLIADGRGPIAIAGVMGGLETAVTPETCEIILEAAQFDAASIRRTRTKLGLATSASYRFERGTDPLAAKGANDRAAALIAEYLGGRSGTRLDIGSLPTPKTIEMNTEHINHQLGTNLSEREVVSILKRLGFDVKKGLATIPSWRHDVGILEDLAEEVARIYGYDQIPRTTLPAADLMPNPDDTRWQQIEAIKDELVSLDWTEHIGSSFLAARELALLGLGATELTKLANPVSVEAAYLRPTQILSLLKVIARNPIFPTLKLFELGTVWKSTSHENGGEETVLTLAWTGTTSIKLPFISDRDLGLPIEPALLHQLKIRRPVMFVEVPIEGLLDPISNPRPVMTPPSSTQFREPSRFQPTLRDIAILVDQVVHPSEVQAMLLTIKHVVDVELFDQFTGGKLPADQQSLAFHLVLEDPHQTLSVSEINAVLAQVEQILKEKFKATLR